MSWLCSKEKADEENENEDALYERLKRPSSALDDLLVAIYEVRLAIPFIVAVAVLVGYQLFVAPYQVEVESASNRLVDLVRPFSSSLLFPSSHSTLCAPSRGSRLPVSARLVGMSFS